MGILESIRKRRAKTKAEIKAAKSRAKTEAKESAKLDLRRAKLLAKQENNLLKAEQKGLKSKRKHERKQAETELAKIKEGKFNKNKVNRWIGASRLLVPVLLPVAYKAVTATKEKFTEARAHQIGVTSDELARFSGHGAPIKARMQGIRHTLEESKDLTPGFVRDAEDRLEELGTAVDNAEYMTPEQRQRAHSSINRDIDLLVNQIQESLTRR
ncbi:DUF6474 family protein [Corynebacterium halotolerans]|uniref:DUF6474 family protein n=1 Tax=Corynebacterium halotolerans TaxID=225326 RepID=UPI003CE7D891